MNLAYGWSKVWMWNKIGPILDGNEYVEQHIS